MSLIRKPVISSSSCGLPSPPSSSKETWTITCYSCGMPSSSVWAKLVRCHPDQESTPYYPHLLELPCPNGAVLSEDGTTHLCAFCFASLESQWSNYEKTATKTESMVHPKDRKYNLQKFVCAVCGVQTYRKRIRALPFQEFPFLTKDRQPGSLTLGQNPLAIVCLDCSETLWAQSAEYERWGLPIQKRHFNWMARPPPPENSMEATVARLPSGETQLPRCPPIEPSVTKGRPHLYSELIAPNGQAQSDTKHRVDLNRHRNYKSLNVAPTSRKSSAPCLSSAEHAHTHAQFPPVVTVAPMSSYKDSVSVRKGASSVPPLASDLLKADASSSNHSSDSLPPVLPLGLHYPASASASRPVPTPSFLDSPAYKALQWHGHVSPRDFGHSYNSLAESSQSPNPNATSTWPWIPNVAMHSHTHPHGPTATEFVNYQSYLASLASRSIGAAESYIPPPSVYTGPLPISQPPHSHLGLSISPYTACASFLSASASHSSLSAASENGNFSPQATFLSPSPLSNSNVISNKSMTPTETPSTPAPAPASSNRLFHPLKIKGSPNGVCDIPPKNRSQFNSSSGGRDEVHNQSHSKKSASSASAAHVTEVTDLSMSASRARSSSSESSGASTSSHSSASGYSARTHPHAHFKKRWNEAQAQQGSEGNGDGEVEVEVAVDLSKNGKKCVDEFSPLASSPTAAQSQSAVPSRKRSYSFSIAFLCSETGSGSEALLSLSSSPSSSSFSGTQPQLSPNQESVSIGLPPDSEDAKEIFTVKEGAARPGGNSQPEVPEKKLKAASRREDSQSLAPVSCPVRMAQALSEEEVMEFVENAKAAYRLEERRRKQAKRQSDAEKEEFLKPLNLISIEEVSELELKKTISRAEKRTLPPLEMWAGSPEDEYDEMEALLQKEIRRALSEIKYSDGGNGNGIGGPDQDFLGNLGLKANSKNEKFEIEQQWCLTLLEKLLRLSRNSNGKGKFSRKWSAEELTKVVAELANICRVDYSSNGNGDGHGARISHNQEERLQQFSNLSVILSPEAEDLLTKQGLFNSADLLSIVNSCGGPNANTNLEEVQEIRLHSVEAETETENEVEIGDSKLAIISPVISYPRYIPSFANATSAPGIEDECEVGDGDGDGDKINGSILNIPNVVRHSFPDHGPDPPVKIRQDPEPRPSFPVPAPVPAICIPKVPIRKSSCSESTHARSHCENQNPELHPKLAKRVQRKDSSEGKLVQVNTNTGTISKNTIHNHNHVKHTIVGPDARVCAVDAEGIIGRYAEVMKGLRHEIDNLLSSSATVGARETDARNGQTQAQAIDQIQKLRSALATYQSDMKVVERRLRKREKEILRSRAMAVPEKSAPTPTNLELDLQAKAKGFA